MILVAGVAAVATLVIYEPQHGAPFAIQDFSEFLPLFSRPSIGQQWTGFLHYYAAQGRWNVLAYAALILKYRLFGMSTAEWQLARFAEMWVVIGFLYAVLRRCGADIWGAAAGAGVFIIAGPAVPAWLRLTMGEPLGLCFLLPAVCLAASYRATAHWRRDAVLIAVCAAAALLVKEMFIAFLPFGLLVACCLDRPAHLTWPRNDERTRWLLGAGVVSCGAVLIPVALVAHMAPPGSYVSAYQVRSLSLTQVVVNLGMILLPAGPSHPSAPLSRFTATANLLFLAILVGATAVIWWRGVRLGVSRLQVLAWVLLGLSLPAAAIAAYAPWMTFQDFYALPFLVAAAILVAGAVTAVHRLGSRRTRVVISTLYIAMVGIAGIQAVPIRARYVAVREVNADAADYLANHAAGNRVLVVAHGFSGAHWPGTGPTLGRYAAALHPSAGLEPFLDDTTCTLPPRSFARDAQAVVVSYADDCGTYRGSTITFTSRYRYLALHPPALKTDSVRIDVCDADCPSRRMHTFGQ